MTGAVVCMIVLFLYSIGFADQISDSSFISQLGQIGKMDLRLPSGRPVSSQNMDNSGYSPSDIRTYSGRQPPHVSASQPGLQSPRRIKNPQENEMHRPLFSARSVNTSSVSGSTLPPRFQKGKQSSSTPMMMGENGSRFIPEELLRQGLPTNDFNSDLNRDKIRKKSQPAAQSSNFAYVAGPENDNFNNAVEISGDSGTTIGTNVGATHQDYEPDLSGWGATASVWWKWTAPETGDVYIDTHGSDFDTIMGVYTGNTIDGLTWIGTNDQDGYDNASGVYFTTEQNTTYYILVDGWKGQTGNIVLNWTSALNAISGWLYERDGVTPITNQTDIIIYAWQGDPCNYWSFNFGTGVNANLDGSFTINGLLDGDYYLYVYDSDNEYFPEYWRSPESTLDCNNAQIIHVSGEQVASDKNFQLSLGAKISGTLYESDGTTPITGEVYIEAYQGDSCNQYYYSKYTLVENDGTYEINGLPDGNYYLYVYGKNANYINEFYADPDGTTDCKCAQSIPVDEGQTVAGKNFILDQGATISGTVFSNGNPIDGDEYDIYIEAYQGDPCGQRTYYGDGYVKSDGTYTIDGLPTGDYYLYAYVGNGNLISEWWAAPGSIMACGSAQIVSVEFAQKVTGKDFQLDPGATISGTVFSNGNPIDGDDYAIYIEAYQGDPCEGPLTYYGYGYLQQNGTYTIDGLPTGDYYLYAYVDYGNYLSGWWDGSGNATDVCGNATSIAAVEGQVAETNFQLDQRATISGTILDSFGNSITATSSNVYVEAYQGDSCDSLIYYGGDQIDPSDGTYLINGLPTGNYYLRAYDNDRNYVSEWWRVSGNATSCVDADNIPVEAGDDVTGKDFKLDKGATISGTLYESDGTTPISGVDIYVEAYQGNPCDGPLNYYGYGYVNPNDGTYKIKGLPEGEYYIVAYTFDGNYVWEWWAQGGSTSDWCGAEFIQLGEQENMTCVDFQLNPGSTITGTIFDGDGNTSITGTEFYIEAYRDNCGFSGVFSGFNWVNWQNGTYTITGLPPGDYYLYVSPYNDYLGGWFTGTLPATNCDSATAIEVGELEGITGKNFQLAQSVLSVTPTSITKSSSSGIAVFEVSNVGNGKMNWEATVTSGSEWLQIKSGNSGLNSCMAITCEYDVNYGTSSRTAIIHVTSDGTDDSPIDVTLIQYPSDGSGGGTITHALSVSPANHDMTKDSGTAIFSVSNTGSGTMSWTAAVTAGSEWLKITSGNSGTNTGSINVSFDENTGTETRKGTIRVTAGGADGSPTDVTVTQAGTMTQPILSITPASQNVDDSSGTVQFTVANTGAGTMNWTASVTSGDTWLRITSGSSGTNSGTITCAFDSNTADTDRTGKIKVTAEGATGSPVEVSVTQAEKPEPVGEDPGVVEQTVPVDQDMDLIVNSTNSRGDTPVYEWFVFTAVMDGIQQPLFVLADKGIFLLDNVIGDLYNYTFTFEDDGLTSIAVLAMKDLSLMSGDVFAYGYAYENSVGIIFMDNVVFISVE